MATSRSDSSASFASSSSFAPASRPSQHLSPTSRAAILALLEDYRDLSPLSGTYKTLSAPPKEAEALRMVHDGRPVIIRGFDPRASSKTGPSAESPIDFTSPSSLTSLFPDAHPVSIAITDDGMADSVRVGPRQHMDKKDSGRRHADEGDVEEFGEDEVEEYFVQPLTEKMSMREFLTKLGESQRFDLSGERRASLSREGSIRRHTPCPKADMADAIVVVVFSPRLVDRDNEEVYYLQSQNGNICRCGPEAFDSEDNIQPGDPSYPSPSSASQSRAEPTLASDELESKELASESEPEPELAILRSHLLSSIPFMDEALGAKGPDAVNLWIGGRRSRTSLHRDPYENVYHVLSGSKTFTVLSPLEGYLLEPKFYPPATLRRRPDFLDTSSSAQSLEVHPDPQPAYPVPWVRVDPTDLPEDSPLRPITIRVEEGETLYLPAGWWHWVEQEEGGGGMCVAVNYWYDQALDPGRYAMEQLIWRSIGREDMVVG